MSNHLKTYLGSQLRIHRKAVNLNQAELGARIERSAEAISNIETGKSLPGIDTLVALSTALDVNVGEFLPDADIGSNVSANRLKREAEAVALLRGLSDGRLGTALAQLKALAEMK